MKKNILLSLIKCFQLFSLLIFFVLKSHSQISESDFVTTWKTDNTSETNITTIIIPTNGNGYNYDVDWNNDGLFDDTGITGDAQHDYGTPGTYTIRIKGNFPRIHIGGNVDESDKILSVDQWGNNPWVSFAAAFQWASNLVLNAIDTPNLVNSPSMLAMFRGASSMNQNINNWDVSNITDMRYMFNYATGFNQPLDNWDVSSVTDMRYMFSNATVFNQNINNWDVSNVTNMRSMFSFDDINDPFNLIELEENFFNQPLNDWDVGNVTNMREMFFDAINFNQPLNNWNVGNVTDMRGMFGSTPSPAPFGGGSSGYVFNQSLSNWDVSNVETMQSMFRFAENFNQNINSWAVSNVTNMESMFSYAESFNQPLDNWNVNNVINMLNMFRYADNFNQPLNSWDVSNVTDMGGMFSNAESFNQQLNEWNVSSVEYMDFMFSSTDVFDQPLQNWDVVNVTTMEAMFAGSLFNHNIDSWDVSSVTNMERMFSGNENFNQPLGNWNVNNVTDMWAMFRLAQSFDQSLENWDISNVDEMGSVFQDTALSTENYDETLISWANLSLQQNVQFDGGNSNYCNSETARNTLINDYDWIITDGGLDCSQLSNNEFLKTPVTLYPNPFKNKITFTSNATINAIKVYNIFGQLIAKPNLVDNTINLGTLDEGVYFINIQTNTGEITRKVIKN